MLKRAIIFLMLFVLLTSLVLANSTSKNFHDFDVKFGDHIELSFSEFSQYKVKVREDTKIEFPVLDKNGWVDNYMIIEKIDGDFTQIQLSLNGEEPKTHYLELGKEEQWDLTDSAPFFILVKEWVLHDSNSKYDRSIILGFRYPFVSSLDPKLTPGEPDIKIDANNSTTTPKKNIEEDSYTKYFLIAIIILLVLLIFLGPFRKKRKSKK